MMVSQHAIERYKQRYRPELSFQDAGVQLRALVELAKPIKETSRRKGHELYAVGNVRMVVTRNTTDRTPLVVTVLPDRGIVDVAAEMQAVLDEFAEERAAMSAAAAATLDELATARADFERAGRDIFIAESLIADGKRMLEEATSRRHAARDIIARSPIGGSK